MQRVASLLQGGAALRRNQVPVRNQVRGLGHGIVTPAQIARRRKLANQDGSLFRVELQFGNQVVIHLLHAAGPVLHLVIGLALMEEEPLDDALLLCNLAHLHDALVNVAAVFVQILDPPGIALVLGILHVGRIAVLVEQVYALPANRDVRHRNLDAVGEIRHHGAPEDIGNAHLRGAMAHRGRRRVELAHLLVRMVRRAQHEEARVLHLVLVGNGRLARHVGLPVGQIDMEIRVLRQACHGRDHQSERDKT